MNCPAFSPKGAGPFFWAVLAALARIRCSQVDIADTADRSVLIANGMI
jgi:hypothetical protein